MAQLPNVIVVGRNTAGIFSDQLTRMLPNGWMFTVSNEEFAAPDGTIYEAVGFPPDETPEAECLPLSEREAGTDSWLDAALQVLESASTESPSGSTSPPAMPSPTDPFSSGAHSYGWPVWQTKATLLVFAVALMIL